MLPQAEMSTAGVIIAVNTAIADSESMDTPYNPFNLEMLSNLKSCQIDAHLDLKKQ